MILHNIGHSVKKNVSHQVSNCHGSRLGLVSATGGLGLGLGLVSEEFSNVSVSSRSRG